MNIRAEELIEKLELVPHPEGGYYREMYRSEGKVSSPWNKGIRNAMTDIYFLLTEGQVSRFHKVAHDELWNFYEGAPLELIEIEMASLKVSKNTLGISTNIPRYKHLIKGDNWQAAYSTGDYSLVGCTVAPGFEFSDFEFLKGHKDINRINDINNPELNKLI